MIALLALASAALRERQPRITNGPRGSSFVEALDTRVSVQRQGSAGAPAVVFVGGTGSWSGLWKRNMRRAVELGFQARSRWAANGWLELPIAGDVASSMDSRPVTAILTNPLLTPALLRRIISEKERATPEWIRLYQQPLTFQGSSNAISRWLPEVLSRRGHAASDDLPSYAFLAFPVVLIWGETDTVTPFSQGIHLRNLLAHGSLVVIPRAGHDPFIEEPELFESELSPALGHL